MDTNPKKSKTALMVTIIIVCVLGMAYFFFMRGGEENLLIVEKDKKEAAVGQDLLILLNQVGRLNLDSAIFENQVFLSLRDFSVKLNPMPTGRKNPFLPIGRDSGAPVPASEESR